MADRYHDYHNYDRGHRYEGGHSGSHSNWGISLGFGFSNFNN